MYFFFDERTIHVLNDKHLVLKIRIKYIIML